MSKFLIVRVAKYKSNAAIANAFKHNARIFSPTSDKSNIDLSKSSENGYYGARTQIDLFKSINTRIETTTRKPRPDANKILEYVYTASPDWVNKQTSAELDEFFKHGINEIGKKHGKANVVAAWIHKDETNPHMHVFVVPLVEQLVIDKKTGLQKKDVRLNAKSFTDGKVGCAALQTEMYEKCGIPFGLERGIERSPAKHVHQKIHKMNLLDKKIEVADENEKSAEKVLASAKTIENENLANQKFLNSRIKEFDRLEIELKRKEDFINSVYQQHEDVYRQMSEFKHMSDILKNPKNAAYLKYLNQSKKAQYIIDNISQDENLEKITHELFIATSDFEEFSADYKISKIVEIQEAIRINYEKYITAQALGMKSDILKPLDVHTREEVKAEVKAELTFSL